MLKLHLALRQIRLLTAPYFSARETGTLTFGPFGSLRLQERWAAWLCVVTIVAFSLAQVAMSVKFSYISRDIYNALQEKSAEKFWAILFYEWLPWVAVYIASFIISFFISSAFRMRWRTWLTDRALSQWLGARAHYRLSFLPNGVDNPDQRIADDIHKFVDTTVALAVGLLKQVTTLVSFSVILWSISAEFTLPGTETRVPGLLLWVAILYALFGTWIANLIGRALVDLNFTQERLEANFRFALVRIREFSESIALLDGEPTEIARLKARFRQIIGNFFAVVRVQKWLSGFQAGYGSFSSIVPFVVGAPYFFAGKIELGTLMQTSDAFGSVQGALSYFIDTYATLAEYKAVVDRLTSFRESIDSAAALHGTGDGIVRREAGGDALAIAGLDLTLPDETPLISHANVAFAPGHATLITGPSGSGKSTLFRAIAGLWPFGKGKIALPQGGLDRSRLMILPQRAYLPNGTLREALAYPHAAETYTDEALKSALAKVELGPLATQLDVENGWTQRLSGGEQQRLAFARALLARPAWLLLDEATSALDEAMEERLYKMLKAELADTSIVSVGHRGTLHALHDRFVLLKKASETYTPVAVPG